MSKVYILCACLFIVYEHRVYKQMNGSNSRTLVDAVPHTANQNQTIMTLRADQGLIPDEWYTFIIDVVALKDGKDFQFVLPGIPSDSIYNLCTSKNT